MNRPLTHKQRLGQIRLHRALAVKQAFLCIAVQGYVVIGTDKLTAQEWREHFSRDCAYRMRLHERRQYNEPHALGTNAMRAADILRHGVKSKWYFARHSTSHAGDDKRGIVHWIRKWERERGLKPPA